MNVKRIFLIGLILVAVVASLSIVSADSSVNVGGFDFNIPDGYIENETWAMDHESAKFPTNDGKISCSLSLKGFYHGNENIGVIVSEFDSSDDAKNVYDYIKENYNLTKRTINGHEGIYDDKNENGLHEFDYCKDKYYISITASDESLIEKVVPK